MTNHDVETEEIQIDLVKLIKELWRRALLVVLAAVVFAAGAFLIAGWERQEQEQEIQEELEEEPPVLYTAKALMYVKPVILSDGEDGGERTSINAEDMSAARSKVATYTVILQSRGVLEEVIKEEKLDYTYEELYKMVSASSVYGTEFFEIYVTGEKARETARIANALADILPERIAEVVEGDDVSVVDYAGVPNPPPEAEEEKEEELEELEEGGIKFRLKPVLIGAFLGAVLAAAAVVLAYLFSNKIHDEDYLAQVYPQVPVLTVVPGKCQSGKKDEHCDAEGGIGPDMSVEEAEAYKLLRTNLSYAFSGEPASRVVGMTSTKGDENKTLAAVNLAYVMAEADKKVLLIEGDMRTPAVAGRLGFSFSKTPGLAELLAGLNDTDSVIQSYEAKLDDRNISFDVIVAGAVPPDPSELLGSERMQELLRQFREQYDSVILALPPAAAVADASVAARMVDGMVVTAVAEQTVRGDLAEAMRRLRLVHANVLGFAFSGCEKGGRRRRGKDRGEA